MILNKLVFALTLNVIALQAIAQEPPALRPPNYPFESANWKPAPIPAPALKEHYVGLGMKRTKHLLAFPFVHPILAFNKGTYPIRHPAKFYENYGHFMAPYQQANDATASISQTAGAIGIFTLVGK